MKKTIYSTHLSGQSSKYSLNTTLYDDYFITLEKDGKPYIFKVSLSNSCSRVFYKYKDELIKVESIESNTDCFGNGFEDDEGNAVKFTVTSQYLALECEGKSIKHLLDVNWSGTPFSDNVRYDDETMEDDVMEMEFCSLVYGIDVVGILGMDFLKQYGFVVDFNNHCISVEVGHFDASYDIRKTIEWKEYEDVDDCLKGSVLYSVPKTTGNNG